MAIKRDESNVGLLKRLVKPRLNSMAEDEANEDYMSNALEAKNKAPDPAKEIKLKTNKKSIQDEVFKLYLRQSLKGENAKIRI